MPTPLIPDMAVFQRKLATLPLATYQAGETVLSAASTTGRLLILKEGAVEVVKEGVEIARVTEPGAVFGELSVLLDQPHTADVRALEASQFRRSAQFLPSQRLSNVTPAASWTLGPSRVSPRRSSHANSLCDRNSLRCQESERPFPECSQCVGPNP